MFKNYELVLPIKTASISLPVDLNSVFCDGYDLEPLKKNISENGILFPLLIREKAKGRYETVCGRRRLLCARALGIKTVPCIKIDADDKYAKIVSVSEAVSTRHKNFFETARELYDLSVNDFEDLASLSCKLGLEEDYILSKLELTKFTNELKQKIISANLSEQQAKQLLRLAPERRNSALEHIVENSLCEHETEDYINTLLYPKKPVKQPLRKAVISDLKLFSNSLLKMLDTLSFAGYDVSLDTDESDSSITYRIKLTKKTEDNICYQLPLC